MKLPVINGKLSQQSFFVYAAADTVYFDRYGRGLINSVLKNTGHGVHLHLYNPTQSQLDWLDQRERVSYTWEQSDPAQFDPAVTFWTQPMLPEPYASRRNKMLGLKQFSDSANLVSWLYKTYYACMRFVRLAEFVTEPRAFLEIDVDGIVRKPFATLFRDHNDIWLYKKDKGGHLAGSILYSGSPASLNFVQDLAEAIATQIQQDNLYWFLDQNCLDSIIVKYRHGYLPIDYVDWHMRPNSAIWSAKGKRKELSVFQQELARYQ